MGWLTLTGEADTDITAGSLRESCSCLLGLKSNINHESQTPQKYKRLAIKTHHDGEAEMDRCRS